MNEKHPIDDLFKGLAEAEVAPPAAVWEGIVAHQSWSNRLLESVRKYWWVPLLFLFFTGAGIGASMQQDSAVTSSSATSLLSALPQEVRFNTSSGAGEAHTLAHAESLATEHTSQPIDQFNSQAPQTDFNRTSHENSELSLPSGTASDVTREEDTLSAQTPQETLQPAVALGEKTGSSSKMIPGQAADIAMRSSSSFRLSRGSISEGDGYDPARNRMILPDEIALAMQVIDTDMPARYLGKRNTKKGKYSGSAGSIPPADWWVGGSIGYGKLSLAHANGNEDLQEALNAGEEGSRTLIIEALAGRIWRTGFFVSAGLGTESLSSKVDFNQTFPIDSTVNFATTNRYNIIRIPLSLGWQKDVGRFELGVHAGATLELGSGRRGYSLRDSPRQLERNYAAASGGRTGLKGVEPEIWSWIKRNDRPFPGLQVERVLHCLA